MAQTTKWLPVIYLELYEEGEVKHIDSVWPVLSVEQLSAVEIILWIKQNPQLSHLLWPFE